MTSTRSSGRSAIAVVAVLVVVGLIAAFGVYLITQSDEGDDTVEARSTTTSTTAEPDGTATSTTTTSTTPDAAGVALTRFGLGELRIGMTKAEAIATGLIGELTPGCELRVPRPEGARLRAPYQGSVEVDGGVLTSITIDRGVATDPGGVRPGDHIDDATAAFEDAGYVVTVDESSEEVFGFWFVRVADASGADVFGTTQDPADGTIGAISTPHLLTCD